MRVAQAPAAMVAMSKAKTKKSINGTWEIHSIADAIESMRNSEERDAAINRATPKATTRERTNRRETPATLGKWYIMM